MITVLIFVVSVSLTLGAFLMLSNTALTKNQATRNDDFSAQLESKLEQALSNSLASYGTATASPNGILPGTAILETSDVPLSSTAAITKVAGNNPWVVTLSNLQFTERVVSGASLKAAAGTGSLPGVCVVLDLQNSSTITCTTTTLPTVGSIKNVIMDDYVDCSPDPLSSSSGAISIICTPFDGSGNGVFFAEEGLVLTGVLPSTANGIPVESAIGKDYGLLISSTGGRSVAVANDVRNYSDAWSGNVKFNGNVLVPSKTSLRSSPGIAYSVSSINKSGQTTTLTITSVHDIKSNEPVIVSGKTSSGSDCKFVSRPSSVSSQKVSYTTSPCTPSANITVQPLPDLCISYSTFSQLTDVRGNLVSCQSKEKVDISESFYFKALQKAVDDSVSRVNLQAATVDQGNFPRCTGLTINTATSVLTVNDSPVSARTPSSNRRVLIVKLNSQVESQAIKAGAVLNVTSMANNPQGDWSRFNGSLTVDSFTLKSSNAYVDEITFVAITGGSTNSLPAAGVTYSSNSGSTAIKLKSDGNSGSSRVTLTVKGIDLVTSGSKQIKVVGFPSPTSQNPAPTGTVAGNALNGSWNLLTRGAPIQISGAPKGVSTQTLQFIYPHTSSGGPQSAGTLWVTSATVVEDYQGNPWQNLTGTPYLSAPAGIYDQTGITALNNLTNPSVVSGVVKNKDPYGIDCPSRPASSSGGVWELRMLPGDYNFVAAPGTRWSITDSLVSIVNGGSAGVVTAKNPPSIKLLKLIAQGKQQKNAKNVVSLTVQLAEKNPYSVGSLVKVGYKLKDGTMGTIPKSGSARVSSADKQSFTFVVSKSDVPALNQLDEYSMSATGTFFECDYSAANPPPATGETTTTALSGQLKSYDDGLVGNPNGVQLNFKEGVGITASNSSVVRLCPTSYVTKPKVSMSSSFTLDSSDTFLNFTNGARLILGGQLLSPKSNVLLSEGSSTSGTATMPDLMLLGGMVVKAASINVSGSADGSIAINQPTYFQGSGRKFLLKASLTDKSISVKKSLCAIVSVDDGYGAKKGNKLSVTSVVKC
jgi:hypothetical protein